MFRRGVIDVKSCIFMDVSVCEIVKQSERDRTQHEWSNIGAGMCACGASDSRLPV